MNKNDLKQNDPLKRQPLQGEKDEGLSPMDPPDAFAPPAMESMDLELIHPFLRQLFDEHKLFLDELNNFEAAILQVQSEGYTKELDQKLKHFFHSFEADFIPHSRREEVALFPLLNERLIAEGEHSKSEHQMTSIDLMEDDHIKAVQIAAVVLNFMGLVFRLQDHNSRLIVLDAALEQGKNLVELLRLHIFREDNIVFGSAHRLITTEEFDDMQSRYAKASLPLEN